MNAAVIIPKVTAWYVVTVEAATSLAIKAVVADGPKDNTLRCEWLAAFLDSVSEQYIPDDPTAHLVLAVSPHADHAADALGDEEANAIGADNCARWAFREDIWIVLRERGAEWSVS